MEITQELLHELFEYRDGVLYWKVKRAHHVNVGDAVGCIAYVNGKDRPPYLLTSINRKMYRIHRLIFLMHHGYLPKVVDHKDNNTLNNRIDNLREANTSENQWNSKLLKNSSSGIKGVCWCNYRKKWKAQVQAASKKINLGYFDDIELAALVAEEARNKYHGEFANHGKQKNEDSSGY